MAGRKTGGELFKISDCKGHSECVKGVCWKKEKMEDSSA